jgi:hypothetical protein
VSLQRGAPQALSKPPSAHNPRMWVPHASSLMMLGAQTFAVNRACVGLPSSNAVTMWSSVRGARTNTSSPTAAVIAESSLVRKTLGDPVSLTLFGNAAFGAAPRHASGA